VWHVYGRVSPAVAIHFTGAGGRFSSRKVVHGEEAWNTSGGATATSMNFMEDTFSWGKGNIWDTDCGSRGAATRRTLSSCSLSGDRHTNKQRDKQTNRCTAPILHHPVSKYVKSRFIQCIVVKPLMHCVNPFQRWYNNIINQTNTAAKNITYNRHKLSVTELLS